MDISCSICIEPFKSNCAVSTTKCGHVFHTKCITFWFQNAQNNCPKCRQLCQNNDFIKTYFDMETKTTTLNSSFFSNEDLAIIIFILLFFMAILLILLFVSISGFKNHHKEKAEDLISHVKILQEDYIGLKELDLGCFMWNEILWMGNKPFEPILSICGLVECTLCRGVHMVVKSLAEGNVNGKPYWIQENGNNAIWYKNGVWLIGKEINLGTDKAEIYSASNHVANPYQVVSWKYASSKNGKWIESNDILVWPKKPMVPQAIWPSFVLLR